MDENQKELLIGLTEVKTEMRNVRADIKELKEGTTSRIDALEREKADKRDVEILQKIVNEGVEVRMRALEAKSSSYAITLGLYTILVLAMISLITYHILK